MKLKTIALAFTILLAVTGALIVAAEFFTLSNVRDIESKWIAFQAGRSEKLRAVNTLRRELGYGGMIHSFKNYVLRKDAGLKRIVDTNLGGARAIIAQYRSLGIGAEEEKSLVDISKVLDAYSDALEKAGTLIGRGESPGEIDGTVKVDDAPALGGLNALDRELTRQRNLITPVRGKPQFISDFRRSIGYGGMIHDFKNFVLRHDHALLKSIETDLAAATSAVNGYAALGVNDAETRALAGIRSTLASYATAVAIAERLADGGSRPAVIDQAVRVDDGPALSGLASLSQEIIAASDASARRVSESLGLVAGIAVSAAWITTALILLLIATSLWLIRNRIVGAITRMTALMTRLAEGDLNAPIYETNQINEIGAMEHALEIFRDTATDRLDQALRFQLVLDNAADGIITINDQGTIELFNSAAEQMFGYSAGEMVGKSLDALLPESIDGNHVKFIGDYMGTGIAKVIGSKSEFEGRRKDGTTIPIELAVTELKTGGRSLFTGIIRDIRDRKQAELVKDQFVSTVSHELRTPLTSIRGSLGLLLGGALSGDAEKTNEMLTLASNNTNRLINLVNDLLDFEKLQSDQISFDYQPVDLGTLVEQAIEINRPYAEQLDVSIRYENAAQDSSDGAQVIVDPDRLIQVLSNFLSNGAKFSPAGGLLSVTVASEGKNIRVSVADNGPGIAPEFEDGIFERFTQADSSDTRHKGGTGLGLSISKAIIEKHGGTIGFTTEVGTGSVFFFEIAESGRGQDIQNQVLSGKVFQRQRADGEKPRILHVEDDKDISRIMQTQIGADMDYDCAATMADARRMLLAGPYDAVIIDPGMPDGSGLDLLPYLNPSSEDGVPSIVYSSDNWDPSQFAEATTFYLKSKHSNAELIDEIKRLVA